MSTSITVISGLGSSSYNVSSGARGPIGNTGPQGPTGPQGDRAGLKYRFDDQTNAGAPQHGHLKFNNSNVSLVTRITISNLDYDGSDMSQLLALIDDSNSTRKARIIIRSNSNSDTSHFNFLVSSISNENNHFHIDGTFVSGSAFSDDEIVTFDYYSTGDKGETGPPNALTVASTSTGAPGSNAEVSISGTSPNQALSFTIPAGAVGPQPSLTITDNATTSITLADGMNNQVIRCTAATAVTVTVPSTLAAGFSCMVIQAGAGQVTFQAGSGTTLNSFGALLRTAGQHAPASLIRVASGVYNLSGNLV